MKHIWKKLAAWALSAALLLPAVPAAQAEEADEPAGDLMSFAGAVSAMVKEYGLESEGEVGLLDLELAEEFATARLIVKAEGEIDPLNAVSVAEGYRDLHILQFADPADAAAAFEVYEAMEGVEWVQPDGIVTLSAESGPSPNGKVDPEEKDEEAEPEEETGAEAAELLADPTFLSWGFGRYGDVEYIEEEEMYAPINGINMTDLQSAVLSQYGGKKSNLPSVTVAVLDSGVMDDHEFLDGYVLKDKGYDFINNDDWAYADHDHGTHVTGTVIDGTRALGNVKILPVKVLDENGSGSDVQVSLGILYAAEQNVDVINMSLGGEGYSYMMREAVDMAVEHGVTVVVSAGNDNSDAAEQSPACFDNVICVASTTRYAELSDFSNYGEVVDVSAPGSGIYSSIPYDTADASAVKYATMSGTSMATPHASAAAALLLTAEPALTPAEVELRMEAVCTNPVEDWKLIYDYETDERVPRGVAFPDLLDASGLLGSGVSGISISRKDICICPGQEVQLTASTFPKKQTVTWKSSNTSVAAVSGGIVTAKAAGTATITASYGSYSAACTVTVQPLELTMPESLTLPVDGSTRVHAVAEGLDPMPELTWSVADPAIAELYTAMEDDGDQPVENIPSDTTTVNGIVIHGLKAGTTTVSATFGSVTKRFTVKITPLDNSWYDDDKSGGFVHHIQTLDDLEEFAWAVNYGVADCFTDHTVCLDSDLNMIGITDYEPIYDFNGIFAGGNHTISNLTITDAEYGDIGLFGSTGEDAVIRDLNVSAEISCVGEDESNVAILVAENDGLIENCRVSGSVHAPYCNAVGGIAGKNSGTVKNCTNTAAVTAHYAAAGIAGENEGPVSGCSNTADIATDGWNTGGIAGYCGGDVADCTNTGTIYGENWHIGGIVGYSYSGTVSGCENTGSVNGPYHVGGIVGQTDSFVTDCVNKGSVRNIDFWDMYAFGGIAGYSFLGVIRNCANTGTVGGDAYYIGGILGYGCGAVVENCRNEAENMIGMTYVGGIVGCCGEDIQDMYSYESLFYPSSVSACGNRANVVSLNYGAGGIIGGGEETAVEYCWNEGNVTCADAADVGGIAGSLANTEYHLRDCTNSGSVSGYDRVGGIIGRAESNTDIEGSAQIYNCVNYGAVSATSTYNSCCGGLAGSAAFSEFRNCLNAGDVSGGKDAGGLVGYANYGTILLENCVVQGQVSGEKNTGLLCGYVVDNYGESEIRVINCYMEPSGSKYGYAGSALTESNCSGFYYNNASGTYKLAKSVSAGGKTCTDLITALNAAVAAEHGKTNGYDLAYWEKVNGASNPQLKLLTRAVRIKISAQEGGVLTVILPQEIMVMKNTPRLYAARYDNGRMTAVSLVDWVGDGWRIADISRGTGGEVCIFGVDSLNFTPASEFVKRP